MKALDKIKEFWDKLSPQAKRILIGSVIGAAAFVIIGVILLNLNNKTEYATMFTGLSQDEAQQIVSYLQEQAVEYKYDAANGAIQVPSEQVDQTRAELLSQGYPKSGFTYDMYINNAGLMTTESDKKQYTMYDLQDRLGSTIRLFDGVKDAKVTIAKGTQSTYALDDNKVQDASASVVVTMQAGQKLTDENAAAIKNLIARSVEGMNFTNVSVFDADTMMEVGADTAADGSSVDTGEDGATLQQLTNQVEANIAGNVKRVLAQLYGMDNIAVSVKGTLNMDRLIKESTQYTVPEKIDEEDKQGLLHTETVSDEASGTTANDSGDVVGTDADAETPRYSTDDGTGNTIDSYSNSSATREWLYNELKQQTQVAPGVLEDATVAVVINTEDTTVDTNDLINLVADASGINRDDAPDKITIIRGLGVAEAAPEEPEQQLSILDRFPIIPVIIAIVAMLGLFLIAARIFRNRMKKKQAEMEAQFEAMQAAEEEKLKAARAELEAAQAAIPSQDEQASDADVQRGQKLKDNIGGFVDENPQVAAKLIQSWLREDDVSNGRQRQRS